METPKKQIIPYMRLLRDDGIVLMPAMVGNKPSIIEVSSDNPIHQRMSEQFKFSELPQEERRIELLPTFEDGAPTLGTEATTSNEEKQ